MCGICRVVKCVTGCGNGRRSNGCGCVCDNNYGCSCGRRAGWAEPKMRVTCASGVGTRSACLCTSDNDCDCVRRRNCECERDCDCD